MDTPNASIATQPGRERVCPECGETFHTTHHSKKFCTPQHKQAYANREAARGKVMASYVLAWRQGRGAGATAKRAFKELCDMADYFNAEDKKAKRPSAAVYVDACEATSFGYDFRTRQDWQADAAWRTCQSGEAE